MTGNWFDEARLGVFVHWGIASVLGCELSWPLIGVPMPALPSSQPVPVGEYYRAAASFRPPLDAPRQWLAAAAAAGARYAVLTAKHHDGYALWPSDFGELSHPDDLVGEFVSAVRDFGMRVGLYYSLSDWQHPDYPAMTDGDAGYLPFLARRSPPAAWQRYLQAMSGQVRELLTRYGPVDVLWFDGGWERTGSEWRADELRAMIRDLAPDCLVNDRLPGHGDYATPEQLAPLRPPDGPWETCLTMNRSWGHVPADAQYKSGREIVHTLCEVAAGGGNLLLNLSPDADGVLPPEQLDRLAVLGRWTRDYGAAVFGTRRGLAPGQFHGPSTNSDAQTNVILTYRPYEQVRVRGVPVRRLRGVRDVCTGRALGFQVRLAAADELGLSPDPTGDVVIDVPAEVVDDVASAFALEWQP